MPKVLLVDDDPRMRALLGATLGNEFVILQAGDGQEALRLAQEEKPDLILLDIMMPGIDGYDVCWRLKSSPKTSSIPVIMLTAKAEREDILRGFEMGADDYFTKPFSPRALLDKINQILKR